MLKNALGTVCVLGVPGTIVAVVMLKRDHPPVAAIAAGLVCICIVIATAAAVLYLHLKE